jgi:hypothetical protein
VQTAPNLQQCTRSRNRQSARASASLDQGHQGGALGRNARYDDQEHVGSRCPRDQADLDARRTGTEQYRLDIFTTHVMCTMGTCQTTAYSEGCRSRPNARLVRHVPVGRVLLSYASVCFCQVSSFARNDMGCPSAGSSSKVVRFNLGLHLATLANGWG